MAGSRDHNDGQSDRAAISQLYVRCTLKGLDTDQIQAEIRRAYPQMHPLEARRHALNWSRQQFLEAMALVLRERDGSYSPLRETDVFEWERKGRVPLQYVDALCQMLRCSAADIGFPEYSADFRPRPQDAQNQEIRTGLRYVLRVDGRCCSWIDGRLCKSLGRSPDSRSSEPSISTSSRRAAPASPEHSRALAPSA